MKNKLNEVFEWIGRYLKDPLMLSKWESEHTRDQNRLTSWANRGYRTIIGKKEYLGDLHMFVEDMHNLVMPYRSRREEQIKASLKPVDVTSEDILEGSELEILIAQSLDSNNFSHRLEDGVSDFIRDSMHTIIAHTEIYYEIVCDHDEGGKLTKFDLHYVFPPTMKKAFGIFFQFIPYHVAKELNIKAGIRFIPRSHILHITAPKELGGKRKLKKILRALADISNTITPPFYFEMLEKNENIGYDFDLYQKRRYLEKAILTKNYGWNQRNYMDDNLHEYYEIYRRLKNLRALAIFRQHLVRELNKSLNNDYVSTGVEITLEGLPTIETVDEEFKKLQMGNLRFNDLMR